eukprot:scaffold110557_cov73-Phaeocystis_antarctica.AAC.2
MHIYTRTRRRRPRSSCWPRRRHALNRPCTAVVPQRRQQPPRRDDAQQVARVRVKDDNGLLQAPPTPTWQPLGKGGGWRTEASRRQLPALGRGWWLHQLALVLRRAGAETAGLQRQPAPMRGAQRGCSGSLVSAIE